MKNDAIPSINSYSKEGLEFVNIVNNVGFEVTFVNLGAAIYSIKYNGKLMTSQVEDVKEFSGEKVRNGKAIGRVAGRIKGSNLVIDKKTYKLMANEGENVLHGGKEGISNKIFSHRVFSTTEHVHVVYTYFSKAGESGFPGNALFEVHYIVPNDKTTVKMKLLSYVTETCPISMTVHTYFSLGEEDLEKLSLKVRAKKYLEIDPETLLLGKEKEVTPCLDFTKTKPILKDINDSSINKGKLSGYDHCYVFDKVDEELTQVKIESNRYRLDIYTDFDAAVIYSDNKKDGRKRDNSTKEFRRSIAVEPQMNPNKNLLISRGDEFSHFIRYEFSKK